MKSRKLEIVISLVVLCFVLKWWFAAPSEVQMKARFVEQRHDFEELRTMFQHDAPPNGTPLMVHQDSLHILEGPSLSASRVQQYHALFKKLRIISIAGKRNDFRMAVFGGGFTDTTWSIGYAFSQQRPKHVVASAYSGFAARDERIFSPLQGKWYLYQHH